MSKNTIGNLAMKVQSSENYLSNVKEINDIKFCILPVSILEEAAKLVGVDLVHCQIEKARSSTLPTTFDTFNALLEASTRNYSMYDQNIKQKIENALVIKDACDAYGVRYKKFECVVGKDGRLHKKTIHSSLPIFGGMSAIMDVCDKYSAGGVNWVLDTIKALGWHNDRKAYCDAIVRALGNVYGAHWDTAWAQHCLVTCIDGKRHNPQQVIIRAKTDYSGCGETLALTQLMESYITSRRKYF